MSYPDLSARFDYEWGTLSADEAGADPIALLTVWLAEAQDAGEADFNAMVVATVDPAGQPTARNVLLRGIDGEGRLRFFTNRGSRKGRELAGNPRVGLLFSWLGMHRQVRVDGTVELAEDAVSDEYFATRPRGSRLSAWASPQSEPIAGRDVLDEAMAAAAERFPGESEVTRPPNWGGYVVTPHLVEFWQGRPSRLHDRIRFRSDGDGWAKDRLAP